MTLQDILDQLTSGELANLEMGGAIGDSGVQPHNEKRIARLVFQGLTELYKTFPISTREVLIRRTPGVSTYVLDYGYAHTNRAVRQRHLIKYIRDDEYNPFTNDVLQVTEVYTSLGDKLPINDKYNPDSVYTPAYNTVHIPDHILSDTFSIMYKANHQELDYNSDPAHIDIGIPQVYTQALLSFVAYKVFVSMGASQFLNEGETHRMRYDAELVKLHSLGLYNDEAKTTDNFTRGGWC